MRFHLFPFRTEKLNSLTPMVLRFSRGRVGSRLFKTNLYRLVFFFVCIPVDWSGGPASLWEGEGAGAGKMGRGRKEKRGVKGRVDRSHPSLRIPF